jgi:hypothetical protein
MIVYVLGEWEDYAPTVILGAYATKAEAEQAWETYRAGLRWPSGERMIWTISSGDVPHNHSYAEGV